MPIFLFHGPDLHSHQKKLSYWKAEFEKKYGDTNTTILDGREVSARDVVQACCSMPFLAEKRFTLVKNFLNEAKDEEKAALGEALETVPDFCVLVFSEDEDFDHRIGLFKRLQKHATVTEFPAMTGSKLLAWISHEVESRGGNIEKDAQLMLGELVGSDLFRLENEIGKLVSYAAGRAITKADIEKLVAGEFATTIFKLTDAIGQKNQKVAVDSLHQLIETGEDLHRMLYMIMRQFRIITCVKDLASTGASREKIASTLKEHPFVVSNTMGQTRNFSMEQLDRAYQLLIEIDTKLKSGGIKQVVGDSREFVLALDRLVLELCK